MVERTSEPQLVDGWTIRVYHMASQHVGGDFLFSLPVWGYLYRVSLEAGQPAPAGVRVAVLTMPEGSPPLLEVPWDKGQTRWEWLGTGPETEPPCYIDPFRMAVPCLRVRGWHEKAKFTLQAEYVCPQTQAVGSLSQHDKAL